MRRYPPIRFARLRAAFLAAGLAGIAAVPGWAADDPAPTTAPAAAKPDDKDKGKTPARPASEVVAALRASAARVHLWPKKNDGETPEVENLNADLANDRPRRLGGFWWSANEVLVEDLILPDHFIRRIEVETSDGLRRYPAELVARFAHARLALLRVQGVPGDASSPAKPLVFAPAPDSRDWGRLRVATYSANNAGEWGLSLVGGPSAYLALDRGDAYATKVESGLLVDPDGRPVGYSVDVRGDGNALARPGAVAGAVPWRGEELVKARKIGRDELNAAYDGLRRRMHESVLEVRFSFRQNREDGEEPEYHAGDGAGQDAPELHLAGWQVGPSRLLVPGDLSRELIGKIEDIVVHLPDGTEKPGRFAGALREFAGVYVEVDGALPGTPLFAPGNVPRRAMAEGELFLRWQVDYATGPRRDWRSYDRPRGTMHRYRDMPVVWTFTNEDVGALAFGLDGTLLAAAIAPRVSAADEMGNSYSVEKDTGFRPLGWFAERLARPDAVDDTLRPAPEEDAKRLVSFGVETQGLTRETARWFGAEKATRGGQIGMLVTHVYPGSPAARAGLREKDILLRLKSPERREPFELVPEGPFPWFNQILYDFDSLPPERQAMIFARIPPPWPPRENPLTALLTGIGEGREVTLQYLRDGAEKNAMFTSEKGPPDFFSAPKFRVRSLGLTVKPVTYEVARYYQRPDAGGAVIVYLATPGSKAQVAGMRRFHLITRVNGQPVADLADFRNKVAAFDEGAASAIEFTIEAMGRTRLVKIEK